jgi:hypothetical protein
METLTRCSRPVQHFATGFQADERRRGRQADARVPRQARESKVVCLVMICQGFHAWQHHHLRLPSSPKEETSLAGFSVKKTVGLERESNTLSTARMRKTAKQPRCRIILLVISSFGEPHGPPACPVPKGAS